MNTEFDTKSPTNEGHPGGAGVGPLAEREERVTYGHPEFSALGLSGNFVAIDVETGGLQAGTHALLSIAAVPSWDYEPFNVFILPDGGMDTEALRVNGYTPTLWAQRGAVSLTEAMWKFVRWLDNSGCWQKEASPLAHNSAFDRGFIDAAEKKVGVRTTITHRWRCSMVAMMALQDAEILPQGTPSLNALGKLSGFWQKEGRAKAHDALQDARACLYGYTYLLSLITKKKGICCESPHLYRRRPRRGAVPHQGRRDHLLPKRGRSRSPHGRACERCSWIVAGVSCLLKSQQRQHLHQRKIFNHSHGIHQFPHQLPHAA